MIAFNQNYRETIQKIVDRAVRLTREQATTLLSSPDQRLSLTMDLMAANGRNGNPVLDLDALLEADDANFAHDVFGIARHMDRATGSLGDCFCPRFAVAAAIGQGGM